MKLNRPTVFPFLLANTESRLASRTLTVERGKEVIVSLNETFVVGDHDFCKFSIIPSVVLINEIPSSLEKGSWTQEKYT